MFAGIQTSALSTTILKADLVLYVGAFWTINKKYYF